MSKAHVPPQVAGNDSRVTSATTLIKHGTASVGRYSAGGMWLRGLCCECNSVAGLRYDRAYGDFARRVQIYIRARGYIYAPGSPISAPPVSVAPGRVARSVMFGMFAISPRLRLIFPELARSLQAKRDHVFMPDGVSLRFAIYMDRTARLTGPVHAHRVMGLREYYETFAEIFFRPLAWVLAPQDRTTVGQGEMSVLDRQGWATADDWLQYGDDVTSADLRLLCRRVPVVHHPVAERRSDWVEMHSSEITPLLEGRVSG